MSSVLLPKCCLINKFGAAAALEGWQIQPEQPRAPESEAASAFVRPDAPHLGFHVDTAPMNGFIDGQLIITPVQLVTDADGHTRWTSKPKNRQAFTKPELALTYMKVDLEQRLAATKEARATAVEKQFLENLEWRQDMFAYGRH